MLEPAPYDGPEARALIVELDVELDTRYPGLEMAGALQRTGDFAPPGGLFLLARQDDRPVGCGAFKAGPWPGVAEVKRMYVVPDARGQRIAQQVLDALVAAAREAGYGSAVLETGDAQPDAVALYERNGWRRRAGYGAFEGAVHSICFELDL